MQANAPQGGAFSVFCVGNVVKILALCKPDYPLPDGLQRRPHGWLARIDEKRTRLVAAMAEKGRLRGDRRQLLTSDGGDLPVNFVRLAVAEGGVEAAEVLEIH